MVLRINTEEHEAALQWALDHWDEIIENPEYTSKFIALSCEGIIDYGSNELRLLSRIKAKNRKENEARVMIIIQATEEIRKHIIKYLEI